METKENCETRSQQEIPSASQSMNTTTLYIIVCLATIDLNHVYISRKPTDASSIGIELTQVATHTLKLLD